MLGASYNVAVTMNDDVKKKLEDMEVSDERFSMLMSLSRTKGNNYYQGSVSEAEKIRRHKKNKQARATRKAHR